ncbi:hypothetical protein BHM03_00060718, partial [Ensete ventricosum]
MSLCTYVRSVGEGRRENKEEKEGKRKSRRRRRQWRKRSTKMRQVASDGWIGGGGGGGWATAHEEGEQASERSEDNDLESDRSYGDAKPLRALQREAGVRRLPKSDSDWLLDKAWTILKKSSFLCRRDWIKLISGMEEAYYGKFVGTEAGLNNKLQLKHPCLNNGYRDKYTCSRCASVNLDGSPLTGGKTMSKKKNGIVVELIGAPQWEECRSLARLTVNRSAGSNFSSGIDCELKPCALSDGLPQPRGKFYAMSGFYVVFQFFNLSSEASLEDVLIMGQKFCGKTWKVAKKSVAPQPFIEQYCFRAPYVASLLRDGLHIKDNQVIIGSGSITWTLGVALLKAGQALSKRVE